MTEKWGQIQRKWDLVRVSGDSSYPSLSYRGDTVVVWKLTKPNPGLNVN